MKNKNVVILSILFGCCLFILIGVFFFKGKITKSKDLPLNISKELSTPFYTDEDIKEIENSTGIVLETDLKVAVEEKIQKTQNLDLPRKYEWCKWSLALTNCILNTPNPITKENYTYRFKEILKLQKTIKASGENVKQKILDEYVNLFSNDPAVLFQYVDDPSIDWMITQCKIRLVEDVIKRNLITEKSGCDRIPEPYVKEFCYSYIN